MFAELKEKLKKFTKKKSVIDEGDDDDILKELGLDDESLLDDDISSREKGSDFILTGADSKITKEKSLLTLSYVVLGVCIAISIGGSTLLIVSNSTQQQSLDELKKSSSELTTEINTMTTELKSLKKANGGEGSVDPNEFYGKMFETKYGTSEIISKFNNLIKDLREKDNVYIDINKYNVITEENKFKMAGKTNSYTNLGKIIKKINESGFFGQVQILGARKMLSADNLAEVPFDFSLDLKAKIPTPEPKSEVTTPEVATGIEEESSTM